MKKYTNSMSDFSQLQEYVNNLCLAEITKPA